MKRLAVLISGSGTNLQTIMDAIQGGQLGAEIAVVVSNRKAAYGLTRAEIAQIPTLYFPLKPYSEQGLSREQYDADLAQALRAYMPDWVVLAGWMHILSAAFLGCFPQRVINLHPALPGTFAGTHAIQRAYAAFQAGEIEHSGCMVHYAVPEVDAGAVIKQAVVPLFANDTLADFETRMHKAEHQILIAALQKLLN